MQKSNGRARNTQSATQRRSRRTYLPIETLERRQMLAGAIDPVVTEHAHKDSPLDGNMAAQYVPLTTFLYKTGTFLTKATAGKPLDIALDYFRANAAVFKIAPEDVGSPIVTDQYTDSETGLTHIYLRQQANGLEIANANANFNIRSDGRILSVGSSFVAGLAALANRAIAPGLDVASAVRRAGANLDLTTSKAPQVLSQSVGTARITTLRNTDLSQDDIAGRLKYVASPDGVKLAWNFILHAPDGQHWYDTSVDANNGSLLFTADWVSDGTSLDSPKTTATTTTKSNTSAKPQATNGSGSLSVLPASYSAAYNVYAYPKKNPDSGPRTLENNPWDLVASQFGWQDTDADAGGESNVTAGNNVAAQEDVDDNNTGGVQPSGGTLNGDGTGSLNFDYPVDLAQAPSTYQNAAIVNLYYWNNICHDIFFRYGFNEVSGNFQQMNYTGQGLGNDRVRADAQDGSGTNNANFSTPPDGQGGRMQMYIWNYASPSRDSSFDSEIIIHEYGHGVSNRLTGGPANSNALNTVQSAGMGEGWSDWWSIMLLQTDGSAASLNGTKATANYSIGMDANGVGIRRYPYSFDKSVNPLTWGVFNSDTETHRTGELWSTTLWDMAVLLQRKWGFNANIKNGYITQTSSGNLLALRLVMDGLKLQPANPSFIQARDAILQADVNLTGGANQREIWQAFARRGLGTGASTANSNATTLTESFDVPPAVSAPVVAHTTPQNPLKLTTTLSSISFRFSEPMNTGSFNVASDVVTFTGPGGTNLKPTINATAVWTNSNKTLTLNFTPVATEGAYTMTIGPSILSADNNTAMDQNLNNIAGQVDDNFTTTFTLDPTPGPDAFGYEASVTAFQNINLAAGGGTTILDNQDDTNASINLGGNSFNFYGQTYTSVFVNDNGLISLGAGSNAFANTNLTFNPTIPVIAPLWDDWATNANASDKVLYQLDAGNNRLIIEWSNVVARGDQSAGFNNTAAKFQAILSLNTGGSPGDIVFNYVDLEVNNGALTGYTNGGSATVGIKAAGLQGANGNNNRLLLSLWNTPNQWLGDSKAIRIGTAVVPTTATVAGVVYEDRNGDGTQLAGEGPISGVTVYADANNNNTLDGGEPSAVSDVAGQYSLLSVPSGSITIREIPPANYIVTNPAIGNVTLTPGETRAGISFGNFLTAYTGSEMTIRMAPGNVNVQVWVDQPVAGAPTWSAPKAILTSLAFTGASSTDLLTVDLTNGNPLPTGGISFNGGAGAFDTLSVKGSTGAETVDFNATTVVIGGPTINRSNVETTRFDGRGGNDTLNINAGANVIVDNTQRLAALNVAATGVGMLTAGGSAMIITNTLSLAGLFDLNDNDMIVNYTGGTVLPTVQSAINAARNGGVWDGLIGLTSSTAKAASPRNTTLGGMEATDFKSVYGPAATFGGESLDDTAVLVKFTYYGDADFNGSVNFDDYSRTDAGFNSGRSGWLNGDFDGNGTVNFDDYSLIDLAFNTQGAAL